MKVTGPNGGMAPELPGEMPAAAKPAATSGAFGRKLGETGHADGVGAPAAVHAPVPPGASGASRSPGVNLVGDISAELSAGKITPRAALDRVVERVLDQQLGVGAPAAVRDQVGTALRNALQDDPHLAEKIRTLGG